MQNEEPKKSKRGFAALSPERRKEIAAKGGRAVQEKGVAHKWDSESAKKAGKKGGEASASRLKMP